MCNFFWLFNFSVLVGFSPRLHAFDIINGHWRYLKWQHTWWNGAYSILLTKASILHRDYLAAFASESHDILPSAFLRHIDKSRNCEDIAMAYVVAEKVSANDALREVYVCITVCMYMRFQLPCCAIMGVCIYCTVWMTVCMWEYYVRVSAAVNFWIHVLRTLIVASSTSVGARHGVWDILSGHQQRPVAFRWQVRATTIPFINNKSIVVLLLLGVAVWACCTDC